MSRLRPVLLERDHNDDDHGSHCGECEGPLVDEVVVVSPRSSQCPLAFCSHDCGQGWLDEYRKILHVEGLADGAVLA